MTDNAIKGRSIGVTWNGQAVAKVRTKGVQINNEPIDITGDDDDGWRNILEEAGEKQVNLTVAGVVVDSVLKEAALAEDVVAAAALTYPDGATLSGQFFIASYSETGEYNGAATFEAELQSKGPVAYGT